MRKYGLIGKSLSHSFSPSYFKKKFDILDIQDATYSSFELSEIDEVKLLLDEGIDGLNVTIPYKQDIMDYLDDIDSAAQAIGAVNCVKKSGSRYIGYNTDWIGFKNSLQDLLGKEVIDHALVLGDGGASKGVCFALKKADISYTIVARKYGHLSYNDLTCDIISDHLLIINTTPLGMYPSVDQKPAIPYEALTNHHFLYDIIYNPAETLFLKLGIEKGCKVKNGMDMLALQAEESWAIWNKL